MTSRDFCYWLQGYFEIEKPKKLTELQLKQIKCHLALVFKHEIDPSIDKGNQQTATQLNAIHSGHINTGEPMIRC